jgi:predicted ATPase
MVDEDVEAIKEIAQLICHTNFKGVTILTGENGTGKSLICNYVEREYKLKQEQELSDKKSVRVNFSDKYSFNQIIDEANPDSYTNINIMFEVLNVPYDYYIFDTPELGLTEETDLALSFLLNEMFNLKEGVGKNVLLVTNSRRICQNLEHDHFFNIQGLTLHQYINRTVICADIDKLLDNQIKNFIK